MNAKILNWPYDGKLAQRDEFVNKDKTLVELRNAALALDSDPLLNRMRPGSQRRDSVNCAVLNMLAPVVALELQRFADNLEPGDPLEAVSNFEMGLRSALSLMKSALSSRARQLDPPPGPEDLTP